MVQGETQREHSKSKSQLPGHCNMLSDRDERPEQSLGCRLKRGGMYGIESETICFSCSPRRGRSSQPVWRNEQAIALLDTAVLTSHQKKLKKSARDNYDCIPQSGPTSSKVTNRLDLAQDACNSRYATIKYECYDISSSWSANCRIC